MIFVLRLPQSYGITALIEIRRRVELYLVAIS
jgi:hypothetical protein